MLVVDPWHWLEPDGTFPRTNPRLRRNIIRVARLIECGAELQIGQGRPTLVECRSRPGRKPCLGLLHVTLLENDSILASCEECGQDQILISNWQRTPWGRTHGGSGRRQS